MINAKNLRKTIITAALVGSQTRKEQNTNVPYTLQEYSKEAKKCYQAGAAILHIHARTDEGENTADIKRYEDIVNAIKENTPEILINLTTSTGDTDNQRVAHLKKLRPEICSFNSQTMNQGIGNWKKGRIKFEWTFTNFFRTMKKIGRIAKKYQIKPEIEVYGNNGMFNIFFLQNQGLLVEPLHFQFVFGMLGGIPFSLENLSHFLSLKPINATWSVCGVARQQFNAGMCAIPIGGHIRVGLEDNIRQPDGRLSKGSYEQVKWAAKLIKMAGRKVASPDDARVILNLRSKE